MLARGKGRNDYYQMGMVEHVAGEFAIPLARGEFGDALFLDSESL